MHSSSIDKMKAFKEKYLAGKRNSKLEIIDLGSTDIGGTYRGIFKEKNWRYRGVDLAPGKNVDLVLSDPYDWREIASDSVDVLVTGQTFEHIEFFWKTMSEIGRVLKPGGLCCIIAPSAGPEHRYPVDCWRFYKDGMVALANYANFDVLEAYTQPTPLGYGDGSDVWADSVLVAKKTAGKARGRNESGNPLNSKCRYVDELRRSIDTQQSTIGQLNSEIEAKKSEIEAKNAILNKQNAELASIRNSRAWRLVKRLSPIRLFARKLLPAKQNIPDAQAELTPIERQRIVDEFHKLYYYAYQSGGTWRDTYWMGVPAMKCPLDLWVYQEIISKERPDLIIESGTFNGGSALFLASVCDLVGNGEVLTIDILRRERPKHKRVTYLLGSSTSEEIVRKVEKAAKGKKSVLVILDSDHSKGHVLSELRIYSRFVTKGSYLIVEDTSVNGNPVLPEHGPGPNEAVKEFLAESDAFEVDKGKEKFFLTFNPDGYLLRK